MKSDSLTIQVRKEGGVRVLTIKRANGSVVQSFAMGPGASIAAGETSGLGGIYVNDVALRIGACFYKVAP